VVNQQVLLIRQVTHELATNSLCGSGSNVTYSKGDTPGARGVLAPGVCARGIAVDVPLFVISDDL
jgi:hypothetical protein